MSFDCWPPRPETTEERLARLQNELAKEQEIAKQRKAADLERQVANLRRENEKDETDPRW